MGEIFGSPGFDHVSYRGSSVGVHASLSDQVGKHGDAEGDHLHGTEGPIGSTFRDLRVGGYAGDVLKGEGGDDHLGGLDVP